MKYVRTIAIFLVAVFMMNGYYAGYKGYSMYGSSGKEAKKEFVETFQFNFSSPGLEENGKSVDFNIPECNSFDYNDGMPVLPSKHVVLTFPAGTRIESIEWKVENVTFGKFNFNASISPSARFINNGKEAGKAYNFSIYPDDWVKYRIGMGISNGKRVVFLPVHIYPMRIALNGSMMFSSSISIRVEYELKPVEFGDVYDMVVIAPEEYRDLLNKLVEYKNERGIRTKFVGVDEIYNGKYFSAKGRDNPEKIKYFLKNAIEQWGIKYVMLVGDLSLVPSRKVYSFVWGRNGMYSDYYYADIYDVNASFCSWDSNGNNRFGETGDNEDKVDLYADLYVGRLLCSSTAEVETMVNKIITYEETAYNSSWFKRIILMGGDTFPKWNDIAEGEVVNTCVEEATPDFEHVKIQTSLHNFHPRNINKIWSEGAGFICYSGHGFEYGFGTYPKDRRRMIKYYTPYLLGVHNGEKLPIIFFDACLTAKLDYYMLGNKKIPCIAWYLVKKPDGGAIATIGSTESATTTVTACGPTGQAGYLDLHFFMSYRHGIRLSEMLVNAKNDYLNDITAGKADDRLYKMTLEQFILLGDPSLMVGGYEER
ncbi:MAG: hypothetical protein J7K61_01880 [Thermoplasmata archaeon]|nr:hypothetical protein [Thermoplasmata archaeon]